MLKPLETVTALLAKLPAEDAAWFVQLMAKAATSGNPLRTLERGIVARAAKKALRA